MWILTPIIIFIFQILQGINDPFVGPNATMANVFSLIADNYIRFGYIGTKFAPIVSINLYLNENLNYYLNHPQLLPIFLSILYRILGKGFWVGRLISILPTLGTLIIIFLIGKIIINKRYAFFSALCMSIIPAASVFGKVLNYEPLTGFFIILNIYLFALYVKKDRLCYLIFMFIFTVLGVLTDWIMIIPSLLMSIYLFHKKKKGSGILLLLTAILTEIIFLIYSSFFINTDILINAIYNRSLGFRLTELSYWPVKWVLVVILRLLLYFNPIFIIFSLLFLIKLIQQFLIKGISNLRSYTFLITFLTGFAYIIIFPEGSFNHAFWIYYLIPFVSFASGYYLYRYWQKKRNIILILLIMSISYSLFINVLKTKQIKDNIWRYDMAVASSKYFNPYERTLINPGFVIDKDMLEYKFSLLVVVDDNIKDISKYSKYLYSCSVKCHENELRLWELTKTYNYINIKSDNGEAYLIDLTKTSLNPKQMEVIFLSEYRYFGEFNKLKSLYINMRKYLKTPQI